MIRGVHKFVILTFYSPLLNTSFSLAILSIANGLSAAVVDKLKIKQIKYIKINQQAFDQQQLK
jgi:hypothetical protein